MCSDAIRWRRVLGQGRYAKPERERRFLVEGDGPPRDRSARLIEDRYLTGTTLRLRRVSAGPEAVHKLTQKVRRRPVDPAEVTLTNLYLSEAEYGLLRAIPADVLTKTRHACPFGDRTFVLDEYHGHLAGLRLAEVEVDELGATLALPTWIGTEVTHDERFSGGFLAAASPAQVVAILAVATSPDSGS